MFINHSEFLSAGIQLPGALDYDQRPGGLSPRRLPAWTRPQVPEVMNTIVRMPSGVRLSLATDSPFIELQVQSTRIFTPPAAPRAVSFDLMINHQEIRHVQVDAGNSIKLNPAKPGDFELLRGEAYTVRFDDLPAALQALDGLSARAVGLLSTDLLANLQGALSLQQRWPDARIAMLAHAFGAAEQLGDLLSLEDDW